MIKLNKRKLVQMIKLNKQKLVVKVQQRAKLVVKEEQIIVVKDRGLGLILLIFYHKNLHTAYLEIEIKLCWK